ncbi:hypothetical protein H7992_05010 [Sporosarcina sp. resist]|uniref:DUF6612 family protein n=1 Tax=Sporosarcina sp. resist TaxID=2762563 RepID=UPI00164E66D8|nr:DUF6612 family protein [Sporosarcina sp. resist]QNK89088.1 hypothetical protein H7992_05010 [Sporosarcina sp. resist]
MKRGRKWLTLGLVVLALVGCEEKKESKEEKTVLKDDGKAEEIYGEMKTVVNEAGSMNIVMKADQSIVTVDMGEELETNIEVETVFTKEPAAVYEEKQYSNALYGDFSFERYVTEAVIYDSGYLDEEGVVQWRKSKNEEELVIAESYQSLQSMIDAFIPYADSFSIEEKENTIQLNLAVQSGKNKKLDELVKMLTENEFEEGTVKELKAEFLVEKKTFELLSFVNELAMDVENESGKVTYEHVIDMKINQYNKVEKIDAPKSVVDQAVEVK